MRGDTNQEEKKQHVLTEDTNIKINVQTICEEVSLPRLERVLDRSMMALLLGLFKTDLLASDMSAVTRVIEILKNHFQIHQHVTRIMARDPLPSCSLV